MKKAIIICIIIALVLIPASAMAAGFAGHDAAGGQSRQGQGNCLKNNQTCTGTECPAGSALKEQRRFCTAGLGNAMASQSGSTMNTGDRVQTRSIKQLRSGLCNGCTDSP